ncbi:IS3 family transposase [Streptomyces sp. NPDC058206]|uniref:IS3 family transposase n=1 Tax=Streptomyces sp. NPDC058206 TaxID=3346382 RepID=UPI0036E10BCD
MTVHPFIEAEKQAGHSVKRACELLKVSRTAFYARRTAKPGPRAVRDAELTRQITTVHQRSRGTYGAPRVHAALKREGARLRPSQDRQADADRRTARPAPPTAALDHNPRSTGCHAARSHRPQLPARPGGVGRPLVRRHHRRPPR